MVFLVDKLIFVRIVQFLFTLVVVSGQQNYETGCPYPVPPDHAVLSAQSYLDEFNFNGFQAYQRVHFICRVGYRHTKGSMWSICGISGRWYPDTRKAGECSREIRTGEIECKGRFRCRKDLQCIDRKLRCDCNADCRDGTDEIGCKNPKKMIFINPKSKKTAGIITSPNYPLGYPRTNFRCRFLFYTDPSYRIKINFEEFSLKVKDKGQCVDYVRLSGIHKNYLEKLTAAGFRQIPTSKDGKSQVVTSCGKENFGDVLSNNSRLEMSVRLTGITSSIDRLKVRGYTLSWKVVSENDANILIKKIAESSSKQVLLSNEVERSEDNAKSRNDLLTVLLPIAISAMLPLSLLSFLCYHFRVRRARNTRRELRDNDGKETGLFTEKVAENKRIKRLKLSLNKSNGSNSVKGKEVSQNESAKFIVARPGGDGLEKVANNSDIMLDKCHGYQGKNCNKSSVSSGDYAKRLSLYDGCDDCHGPAAGCHGIRIRDSHYSDDVISGSLHSGKDSCSKLHIEERSGKVRYSRQKKNDLAQDHDDLLRVCQSERDMRGSICGTREEIENSIADFEENSERNFDNGNADVPNGSYFYQGNKRWSKESDKKRMFDLNSKCLETKTGVLAKVILENRCKEKDKFEKECDCEWPECNQKDLYSRTSTKDKFDTSGRRKDTDRLESCRARNCVEDSRHYGEIKSRCYDLKQGGKSRRQSRAKRKHRQRQTFRTEHVDGDHIPEERLASFVNRSDNRFAPHVVKQLSGDGLNCGTCEMSYKGPVDWNECRKEGSGSLRYEGSCRSNGSDSGTCTGSELVSPFVDSHCYDMPNADIRSMYLRPNSHRYLGTTSDTDSASRESAYTESLEGCMNGNCVGAGHAYMYDGTVSRLGSEVCNGMDCYDYYDGLAGYIYSDDNNVYGTYGRGYSGNEIYQAAWFRRPTREYNMYSGQNGSVLSNISRKFAHESSLVIDANDVTPLQYTVNNSAYLEGSIVYDRRCSEIKPFEHVMMEDNGSLSQNIDGRGYTGKHCGCGMCIATGYDDSVDGPNDPLNDKDIVIGGLS
eukprot:gene3682-14945_t